jgi:DNA-binding transcriptional LysR family regulator
MRFDLVDLKLFLHVADARSITHGAERANLALASASARIRGMEDARIRHRATTGCTR